MPGAVAEGVGVLLSASAGIATATAPTAPSPMVPATATAVNRLFIRFVPCIGPGPVSRADAQQPHTFAPQPVLTMEPTWQSAVNL